MKRVILINQLAKRQIEDLRNRIDSSCEFIVPDKFDDETITSYMDRPVILLGDKLTKAILDKGNIEFIQVPWAGVDKIDFDLLSKYDYKIANSHSNALSVAEYAVGMLLSIGKKIPYHDRLMRQDDWNRTKGAESLYSSYLYGKTIGFIGYGNIGKNISRLLRGFDPKIMVVVSDKNRKYEGVDFVGDLNDINYVLENSDYVVVAMALTDETKGILNKDKLQHMKETAYLINIARGEVVDQDGLYYVLENRLIQGAAIDTWYNYPVTNEKAPVSLKNDFTKLTNIIMTPHRAAQIEGEFTFFDDAVENINNLLKGQSPKNIIDITRGY